MGYEGCGTCHVSWYGRGSNVPYGQLSKAISCGNYCGPANLRYCSNNGKGVFVLEKIEAVLISICARIEPLEVCTPLPKEKRKISTGVVVKTTKVLLSNEEALLTLSDGGTITLGGSNVNLNDVDEGFVTGSSLCKLNEVEEDTQFLLASMVEGLSENAMQCSKLSIILAQKIEGIEC